MTTTIINQQQAKEIAKKEALKQIQCNHVFESRHIELLDLDVQICSKCDINKNTYLLAQEKICFGQYCWYKPNCWTCPIDLLCQAKKSLPRRKKLEEK